MPLYPLSDNNPGCTMLSLASASQVKLSFGSGIYAPPVMFPCYIHPLRHFLYSLIVYNPKPWAISLRVTLFLFEIIPPPQSPPRSGITCHYIIQ